jgi:hypothetical protein
VEPFKLHPTSMRYTILHIYNVVEHIDMLSIGVQQQPWYTVYPHYLDQMLRFWVTCDDVSMSSRRISPHFHTKLKNQQRFRVGPVPHIFFDPTRRPPPPPLPPPTPPPP